MGIPRQATSKVLVHNWHAIRRVSIHERAALFPMVDKQQWNDRWSAQRLYVLFKRYQADGLSNRRMDQYARLLMVMIRCRVGNAQGTGDKMKNNDPRIEDIAQEIIIHLIKKTKTMKIKHEGWRPLIAVLNTAIHFHLLTLIKASNRRCPMSFSSYDVMDILTEKPPPAPPESDDREIKDVARELAIRLIDSRAEIIGDLAANCEGSNRLSALFDLLVCRIIHVQPFPTYEEISLDIDGIASPEEYAVISARIRRVAKSFAGGKHNNRSYLCKATA